MRLNGGFASETYHHQLCRHKPSIYSGGVAPHLLGLFKLLVLATALDVLLPSLLVPPGTYYLNTVCREDCAS